MLVLSRKNAESVVIGGCDGFPRVIRVTVLGIRGASVKLGFEADVDVPVHRAEVWEERQTEDRQLKPIDDSAPVSQGMDRWEDDGGGPSGSTPRKRMLLPTARHARERADPSLPLPRARVLQ